MRLYIEPLFAYNEFEQELQYLGLSTLIEDREGNNLHENHLSFKPIFGVDSELLHWLGIYDNPVTGNDSIKDIAKEIETINGILEGQTEEVLIVTWNNIFAQLPNIQGKGRVVVFEATGEGKPLTQMYKKATGLTLVETSTRDRLYATREVYNYILQTRLTEQENQTRELTQMIEKKKEQGQNNQVSISTDITKED